MPVSDKSAMDCYTRCAKYQKVSDLLPKNSKLHPGLAHYEEMESYAEGIIGSCGNGRLGPGDNIAKE